MMNEEVEEVEEENWESCGVGMLGNQGIFRDEVSL
jgi:hypothetical protein